MCVCVCVCVCITQLSGASLDLFHADLVCYRRYKRKSVGVNPVHVQICVLLLRRGYMVKWYMMCVCVCVWGGGGCFRGCQPLGGSIAK